MADGPRMEVVVDASAVVDLLAQTELRDAAARHLAGTLLHAPAHLDAEVLSALGRLERAGHLDVPAVERALTELANAPIERHQLPALLAAAWSMRHGVRLVDALYVALAEALDVPLVTTDARLARAAPRAQLVE